MHSTNNLEDGYVGSGKKLWYSIKKYRKENFITEILEYCESREALGLREKELVNKDLLLDSQCMNLMIGGEGGGGWETCNKNSLIQKNKSIKGLKKLADLWNNDKEWSNKVRQNFSKSFKLQYLNKTRIPVGWSSNALLASMNIRMGVIRNFH